MAKRLKFYAVTHDILGDVFWEVFRRGLIDAADRYDVDVEHLRPGKFSPEIQAGLIEGATHARPDGLISTVPDIGAVDGPLRRAVAAGIPLICINAKDPRPAGERIPYLFYIGGDDGHAGEFAGRYVLEKVRPRAALCVDHYLHEHICHNDRWQGFRRACEAAGVPVERLRIPGGDPAACASAVRERLEAAPVIDAVLTLGPPGAEAVLAGSEGLSGGRQVPHLTFDVAQLQIDGIRSGRILATIDSQQYLQGYLSVEAMWLHKARGFTLASDIHTGPAIVDASNLAAAEDGVRRGYR
ncbi:sugar ABC transporter substrate-binding protein [Labrys wisconsinensis]|uniref:Simple sugar transport system substrate-binding protein n=1 Tax=Labrys wisconsinensis TaxID=425677 RepID=A0ABU0JIA4_9HYPH|nr:sugar ABC transporter substrate-binding protein [Labrys wisconsinensis]MDQ0474018.1 simple sugar transport system substrate-binding protein [Labrys wisconsinensis]